MQLERNELPWKSEMNYPELAEKDDLKEFEKNNVAVAVNVLYAKKYIT